MRSQFNQRYWQKDMQKSWGMEALSLILFFSALFCWCSLFTFDPTRPMNNLCGQVGGIFSLFLIDGLGLGAYLLPISFIWIGFASLKKEWGLRFFSVLSGMLMILIASTVLLALQWKVWNYQGSSFLVGGAFGTLIAEMMSQELNTFGASLVTTLVLFLALSLSLPFPLIELSVYGLHQSLSFTATVFVRSLKMLYIGTLYFLRWGFIRSLQMMRVFYLEFSNRFTKILKKTKNKQKIRALEILKTDFKISTTPQVDDNIEKVQNDELEKLVTRSFAQHNFESTNHKNSQNKSSSSSEDVLDGIKILPREVDPELKKTTKPYAKPKHGHWKLPTIEFLKNPPEITSAVDRTKLVANSQILKQKFADFGIDGEVTAVRPGPVITLYEFKPGPGVKVSRIAALADDLSMALSAQSVRILAPLPGKSVVGIEIPSDTRETVYLREFLQHPDFYGSKHSIPVIMGKEIGGHTYLSDLARMPHLLCAGQTGSGKSVFMNGLICSLIYRFTPDELRMILVDPKFIEFRSYQDIPHLLLPVVDDPKQASIALKWAVREMERRYRILSKIGARNLASFNQKIDEMGADVIRDLLFSENNENESYSSSQVDKKSTKNDWLEAFEPDEHGAPRVSKLPYIVVIIDELADLMMVAKKEVEISIARIAQKARAAGIHLVIATQRPSTDVITGLIKANLPSRVSFQLASYVDSKTILDRAGAERLLGQGDMLFIPPGVSQTNRLHGAYVDDDEIHKVTQFLRSQGKPIYRDEILLSDEEDLEDGENEFEDDDELFQEAIQLVKNAGHASASFLQRNLKVGYNRAARMIETMESRGIVGPQDGARPREVLMR